MVGLRRPKKRSNTTATDSINKQPLVTPGQRILQRQWLGLSAPRLPQGTEISLVSVAAKRPKTAPKTGAVDGPATRVPGKLQNIRSYTVVPALISPLSVNNDENVVEVVEAIQGEARAKMADPTPTEEAVVNTADASSARDAASAENTATVITIIADVHAPAMLSPMSSIHDGNDVVVGDDVQGDVRAKMAEPTPREQAVVNTAQASSTRVAPSIENIAASIADVNEESPSLSQDDFDEKFKVINGWKKESQKRLAAFGHRRGLLKQEADMMRSRLRETEARLREIEAECSEIDRSEEKLRRRYQTLFTE